MSNGKGMTPKKGYNYKKYWNNYDLIFGKTPKRKSGTTYKTIRSIKYDAYYDPIKLKWLEKGCGDSNCDFCANRPEFPIFCSEDLEKAIFFKNDKITIGTKKNMVKPILKGYRVIESDNVFYAIKK